MAAEMSSQRSYHTALEMPSSAQSTIAFEQPYSSVASSLTEYRSAKQLPYELREHCLIYFEEELCTFLTDSQGLTLLLNLISAGTSSTTPNGKSLPAYTPPPQHLSLAATLVVHPSLTTRATSVERLQSSNTALRLLRLTNKLVGPLNADFGTAFSFSNPGGLRRRNSNRRRAAEEDSPGDYEDVDAINTELAGSGSLWASAEDFWQVVGWAFNCSVVHPKRWARWRLWLSFMLDVLEDDWVERVNMHEQKGGTDDDDDDDEAYEVARNRLEESMIIKYLFTDLSRFGGAKRIVRAIFADGSTRPMNEFREIFKNETKELRKDDPMKRRFDTKVNVEEDIFGDYIDRQADEEALDATGNQNDLVSSQISEDNIVCEVCRRDQQSEDDMIVICDGCNIGYHQRCHTPRIDGDIMSEDESVPWSCARCMKGVPEGTLPSASIPNGAVMLGGMDSLLLRQRLLAFLSTISATHPTRFTTLDDLYDIYIDNLRPLSLPTFHLLLSPSTQTPHYHPAAQSSLTQLLLRTLIASSAPLAPTVLSMSVGEAADTPDELTQEVLERCYLPFPATTANVADNAKVSILVEALLRLLALHGGLEYTAGLQDAIETGIRERERKAKGDGRRKGLSREEEAEKVWLRGSAGRLRVMAAFLKEEGDGRDEKVGMVD
ncbi:MAG: hypothetical protein M1827_003675 [Pycnora praestabilis]|nr:MAG: hypothetical protein M1827_003675 [Pycnora praestabilis]